MPYDRVMVFIDGANLFHGSRNYGKQIGEYYKYDIRKLVLILVENRSLGRVYYYNSLPPEPLDEESVKKADRQIKFYEGLKYDGYQVTTLPLKSRTSTYSCPSCSKKFETTKRMEKGIDVALVTDMLSLCFRDAYDIAILVSGDFDFHKALEEIKHNGKRIEIAYFKSCGISRDFIKIADKFIDLDRIADDIRR